MKYLLNHLEFELLLGRGELAETQKPYEGFTIVYFTATWCGACKHLDMDALEEATTGIQWLVLELQAHIRRLDIPQPDVDKLIHLTGCDLHWWTALDRMPTVLDCDPLIHTLRKDMQGRLHTDFHTKMNGSISHREHMRQIRKRRQSSALSSLF
jgi:thiol-disulfide isomerase/thioredoxin